MSVDDPALDALIARADLDGLVRLVDSLCAAQQWERLWILRERARSAVSTGRQLWPAATLAEYRLALWADPAHAARVLDEGSGRFTIGPLTEVVAQHHSFESLRPFLDNGPRAAFVAHERVLRGGTIEAADLVDVLELPFALLEWEPDYVLATYSDEGIVADPPAAPAADVTTLPDPGTAVTDEHVDLAVRQLVEPWTTSSNGRAEVVCVEGDAFTAIATLGLRAARVAAIGRSDALRWLAWAGASGGAMGRRRGGALGRFGAWWTLAALADLTDEWPVAPAQLAEQTEHLRWFWWHAAEPVSGWELQLAVEDPVEGYAWAINARDSA